MVKMIEWLYSSWEWIAIASVIIGIIGVFIQTRKKQQRSGIALTSLLLGLAITFLCLVGIVHGGFTQVPHLRGITVDEAIFELNNIGLNAFYPSGQMYNNEVGRKTVTDLGCTDNTIVIKGTNILLDYDTASEGLANIAAPVRVPNLVGEKYTDAIDKLIKAGLFHRIADNNSELLTLDKLFVASQSIAPDISVPTGSIIGLELTSTVDAISDTSNSTLMVSVPDLINMEEKEAQELLLEKGFKVSIQAPKALDDSLDHYFIISQSIKAGTEVPVGINITLEKGAVKVGAQVTVPDLIGMEQSEATALLINRGLSFQVSMKASDANSGIYYVIDQSISPNSQVTSGTIIRLELSSKKP